MRALLNICREINETHMRIHILSCVLSSPLSANTPTSVNICATLQICSSMSLDKKKKSVVPTALLFYDNLLLLFRAARSKKKSHSSQRCYVFQPCVLFILPSFSSLFYLTTFVCFTLLPLPFLVSSFNLETNVFRVALVS